MGERKLVRREIDGLAFVLDLVRRYPDDRVMRAWAVALISGQRKAGFRIFENVHR